MSEQTIVLPLIELLLISFFLVIVGNGYRNRKVIKAAQWLQYFWFLATILVVIITIINHLYNLKLWQI